jgi:hypothetical protein
MVVSSLLPPPYLLARGCWLHHAHFGTTNLSIGLRSVCSSFLWSFQQQSHPEDPTHGTPSQFDDLALSSILSTGRALSLKILCASHVASDSVCSTFEDLPAQN